MLVNSMMLRKKQASACYKVIAIKLDKKFDYEVLIACSISYIALASLEKVLKSLKFKVYVNVFGW